MAAASKAQGKQTRNLDEIGATELHDIVRRSSQNLALEAIRLGEALRLIRDKRYYAELGFESFEDYGKQVAGLGVNSLGNYIRISETFGGYGFTNEELAPYSKLIVLLPVVRSEEAARRWLKRAQDLRLADLRFAVRQALDKKRRGGNVVSLKQPEIRSKRFATDLTDRGHKLLHSAITVVQQRFGKKTYGEALEKLCEIALHKMHIPAIAKAAPGSPKRKTKKPRRAA
jgi:hypothetical protein